MNETLPSGANFNRALKNSVNEMNTPPPHDLKKKKSKLKILDLTLYFQGPASSLLPLPPAMTGFAPAFPGPCFTCLTQVLVMTLARKKILKIRKS